MNEFHFLRPWWWLAIIPTLFFAWRLWRNEDSGRAWRAWVAPHLLPRLRVGSSHPRHIRPITIVCVAWLLAIGALAGPTWEREPAPFADDTTALAIVLKVTPSMQSHDIQPARQTRAAQKIHDLLALRPNAQTALFAYAGSAHRVMPFTTDAGILDAFTEDLAPDVMPVDGAVAAAALALADETVQHSGQAGWILWIADAATPEEMTTLQQYSATHSVPVSILAVVAGEGPEWESLKQAAAVLNAPLVRVTPDTADVHQLVTNSRFSSITEQAGSNRWRDAGYWLSWPITLIGLLGFRRGWMIHTAGGG